MFKRWLCLAGVVLLSASVLVAGVSTMRPASLVVSQAAGNVTVQAAAGSNTHPAAVTGLNSLPAARDQAAPTGVPAGGPPTAACCHPDGSCTIETLAACTALGGVWHYLQNCAIAHCPPGGACCFPDGHCEQLTDADCTAAGGWSWAEGAACDPNPCPARGDLNCDGSLNAFDIDPFVLALTSGPTFEAYYAIYPDCDALLADANCDAAVNAFDIDPFVQCLTSGNCPACP